MSHWNNYGVSVTDTSRTEDIKNALEELGLKVWTDRDDNVHGTDFAGGSGSVSTDEVKQALSRFMDSINALVQVDANDTSDTAYGQVYEVDGSSFERGESRRSGGESTRRDWYGISHDGVTVDGGKR